MKSAYNCYHCGEVCDNSVKTEDKYFCCNGCQQVFLLLKENNLCNYYNISENSGIKAKGKFTGDRFAYLDDEDTVKQLVLYKGNQLVNVQFSLPQIHCASCIYLLEKLHSIEEGITHSRVNFPKKEIFISFNPEKISLRKVVELLSFVGYEPNLSLQDSLQKKSFSLPNTAVIKIGVAGFCFGNIMMMSFPEYFSGGLIETDGLKETFSWFNLFLSLPVLFYSASSIFKSAFAGLRQKDINIDVPIALAIIITFARSYYEIISGKGAGYLDSGTGIIFFMIIGRWFQNKTYETLSFNRKYQSYFPMGVIIRKNEREYSVPLNKLSVDDVMVIRHNELIPADSVLLSGDANIDYSFVNGEAATQLFTSGDFIYAGGRQMGKSIVLKTVKLPSQSYLTELWNNSVFDKDRERKDSFVHPLSRYFTIGLFSIAFFAGIFWFYKDSSQILNVITSVLIVACPCSLLLTSTFTFGNMLRILGKHSLFLKNAGIIESLSDIQHIVFDKTGTLNTNQFTSVSYFGNPLSYNENALIKKTTAHSSHILSRAVNAHLTDGVLSSSSDIDNFEEYVGRGIAAGFDNQRITIGSRSFVSGIFSKNSSSEVHVRIGDEYKGYFSVKQPYRDGVEEMLKHLKTKYQLHILSGDNNAEEENLKKMAGPDVPLIFNATPEDKLNYIKKIQSDNQKVMMIGDGLNDAGALMQANAGIAISDNNTHFTPASDGIMDGSQLYLLPKIMHYIRMNKKIVLTGFGFSILYNIVGLSFAVQSLLQPVVAAILMPVSSITIVALAIVFTNLAGRNIQKSIAER